MKKGVKSEIIFDCIAYGRFPISYDRCFDYALNDHIDKQLKESIAPPKKSILVTVFRWQYFAPNVETRQRRNL
jgi:hypothetical protein